MRPPVSKGWVALAAVGGLAYPFLVYFGITVIPPAALLLVALILIAARIVSLSRLVGSRWWLAAFGVAALGLIGLLAAAPALAVKAYPVAVSLAVAAVFALSLVFPPTLIERIARLTEPDLPPEGVIYTRKVTWVWVFFLIGNAIISIATALYGSLEQWTLWNGFLSYIAMGALFSGELVVRRVVRRRHQVLS
ncbi:MAG TPA: hypothetical protein VGG27_20525 [Magnetospirillaceae bacterium]|jgi:uncharacterized membrane protein